MTERTQPVEQGPDMQKMLGQLIPGVYVIGSVTLLVYIFFFASSGISKDPGDWGTLGDYFGGLMNPVVSYATLVVAYAVWKQQREELRETKVALEKQAKTAEQQRQEQRFFDLLRVYNQTLDSYTSDVGNGGLFQSQLSDDEVRLIGLLSWIDPRWSNHQALLEKYCLLQNFPEGPLRSDLMNLIGSRSFSEESATPC